MLKKLLPILILAVLIFIFFLRLFYPTQSLFMIPDFGESDVLHLNLPLKYILSESLKGRQWPLWTPHLAGGFPVLAEGQIGTFYLPNLLLFRFLPLIWAYNLNLVISYLLASFGTYLFARKIGLSTVPSFFASFIFTFSGFLAVHLNHFNLIQAASLLPFVFWSAFCLWKKPSIKNAVLFAFFLSQQIFTGHFYIVFITLVGIVIFLIAMSSRSASWRSGDLSNILKIASSRRNVGTRNGNKIRLFFFIFSFFIAFFLSAIQFFPTIELWQLSNRQKGLDFNTVTDYPYPFKHLITFVSPYFFGSPADGTYPAFSFNWGIFWENTAYVGIIPLTLAAASLFFLKDKLVKIFLLILFICLLLVLGRNSPLYFIFTIFPFNLFRVPSKFLLLVTFSLSILAAISLERIKSQLFAFARFCDKRKIFYLTILVILLFLLIDEYRFSYNYPPPTPASWWTTQPEIAKLIPKDSKIASLGAPFIWNKVFKKEGWRSFAPYVYFKNSLYPNYNAFSSLSSADINTGGLIPRRLSLFTSNIKNIEIDEEKKEASVSSTTLNALSSASVTHLISPYRLDRKELVLQTKIEAPQNLSVEPFYIYKNRQALPRFYLAESSQKLETLEEFYNKLADENFMKDYKVMVEDDELRLENPPKVSDNVKIMELDSTQIVLETNSDKKAILVLTDTNYAGWRAYLDDSPVKIYNVNLVQRGILVSSGKHQVRFSFYSDAFENGKKITVISSLIISLVVFASLLTFPRKFFERIRPFLRLGNRRRKLKT